VIGDQSAFEWVKDPRPTALAAAACGSNDSSVAATEDDEVTAWLVAPGVRAFAVVGRIDHTRLAGEGGRYSPPLACGPVGDLTFDQWWERLPDPPKAPARLLARDDTEQHEKCKGH